MRHQYRIRNFELAIAMGASMLILFGKIEADETVLQTVIVSNNPDPYASNGNVLISEGEVNSNGLSCTLRIQKYHGKLFCTADINNKSTNIFDNCWNLYDVKYLKVELKDSNGSPATKTEFGKLCGIGPNQEQWEAIAKDRNVKWVSGRARTRGIGRIVPSRDFQFGTQFDVLDLFEIKRPGIYTLHVKMPVIQVVGSKFQINWLPEVSGKIRIECGKGVTH